MFRGALKRINGRHIFVLLLLISAILQPAHTTDHNFQAISFHASKPVLVIGDTSSFKSFSEHREKHDNELCGQCQFGFMGDGVHSPFHFSASYIEDNYALAQAALVVQSRRFLIRNRGPPLS